MHTTDHILVPPRKTDLLLHGESVSVTLYGNWLGSCRMVSPSPDFMKPDILAHDTYRRELGTTCQDALIRGAQRSIMP